MRKQCSEFNASYALYIRNLLITTENNVKVKMIEMVNLTSLSSFFKAIFNLSNIVGQYYCDR